MHVRLEGLQRSFPDTIKDDGIPFQQNVYSCKVDFFKEICLCKDKFVFETYLWKSETLTFFCSHSQGNLV